MHQFGTAFRAATVGLIATTLIACAADKVLAPTIPVVSESVSDSVSRSYLMTEITTLQGVLASNSFYAGLDQEKDAGVIAERRRSLQGFLAYLEGQVHHVPYQRPALAAQSGPVEAPLCFLNGNLDGCFLTHSHTILINGTGTVTQTTSTVLGQGAVVAYTDNGSLGQNIPVGMFVSSIGMSLPYKYPKPDCNVKSHVIASTATHQVSLSIIDWGTATGAVNSTSSGAACAFQGLTVSLSPSTIGKNGMSSVNVSGMKAGNCDDNFYSVPAPTVTSSNSSTGTIQNWGPNQNTVSDGGTPGTATITAKCGPQTGSATLTVNYPNVDTTSVSHDTPGGSCSSYVVEESDDYGPWYQIGSFDVCPDGIHITSQAPSDMTATNSSSRSPTVDVTLVASGPLDSHAPVATQHRKHGKADAVILVDTTSATAADLDAALFAVIAVSDASEAGASGVGLQATPSHAQTVEPPWANGNGGVYLELLRHAPVTKANGRSLQVSISLPKTALHHR